MLKVEKKVFEKVVDQLITSTDIRELIREFSLYRVFFYSLLSDISQGKESRHYYILKRIARDRKISEEFIIEQARSLLSHLGPDRPKENYYEMLDVSPTASAEEIRKSWINLIKTHHPDTMGEGGLDATKRLNEAYEVLKDPVKRREYNTKLDPISALPIFVINPRTFVRFNRTKSSASRKFLYPATLIILISTVVFYLVESGLLFDTSDKISEFMGPVKGKPEYKVEEDNLVKSDSVPSIKGPFSSEPRSKEKEVIPPPPKEDDVIFNDPKEADEKEVDEKKADQKEADRKEGDEDEKEELPKEKDTKSLQEEKIAGEGLKEKKYPVKKGDTLSQIAETFNTPVKDLKAANMLEGNEIESVDLLIIPTTTEENVKPLETQTKGEEVTTLSISKEGAETAEREKEPSEAVATTLETKHSETTQKEILKSEIQTERTSIEQEMPKLKSSAEEYESASYPDKTSLYYFVLEYVSAYKSRDMNRFISLFEPGARENGVAISGALSSYRDNFSSLRIVEYNVQVKSIDFEKHRAFVDGDFAVTFRNKNENRLKNSSGNISWLLSWLDNKWKIKELNYRIKDTK